MAEKTRKPQRPRLDAVIKHIKSGSYDDDMSQLKGAIEDRQNHLKQVLMNEVKRVFGDDYEVKPAQPLQQAEERKNPFFNKAQQADPDLAEAEARARQEEAALRDSLGDDAEPNDSDYESRSPIIGPGPAPAA